MNFKKIYIEITNICNLSCSFCAKNRRTPAYMKLDQFTYILQQLQPHTSYLYFHVLGEPLLHPELSQFLSLAKAYGFHVNITTNGTLLKEQLDVLQGRIRQCNISLHSKPMEDGCHCATYLEDCLTSGDVLAKHGTYVSYRFWNKKQGHIDVESKTMLDELAAHYKMTLTTYENQKLAPRRFLHFEEQFTWPNLHAPVLSNKGMCYGMRTQCAILVDGSVVPCCLDSLGGCTIGNVFETPFQELMKQPRAIKMKEGFQQRTIVEPLCLRCGYRLKFEGEKP